MAKSENKNDFYEKVYTLVRQTPIGKVTTYGAIAKRLGSTKSSRLVGYALNASHALPDVPAHRVVNRKGLLSGRHHFATPMLMQELLENEGIEIKDHQIVNFEQYFWEDFDI